MDFKADFVVAEKKRVCILVNFKVDFIVAEKKKCVFAQEKKNRTCSVFVKCLFQALACMCNHFLVIPEFGV